MALLGEVAKCVRSPVATVLRRLLFTASATLVSAESIEHAVRRGVEQCDVIVSTGGQSMGDKDLVRDVLVRRFNARLLFARVNMKPGKPTSVSVVPAGSGGRSVLLFGLPGNPVSAAVTCRLFVLPAIQRLMGCSAALALAPLVPARLLADYRLDPRPEFVRAQLLRPTQPAPDAAPSDLIPCAHITGSQLSSRLLSCSGASVLLRLPPKTPDCHCLPAGTVVDALMFDALI